VPFISLFAWHAASCRPCPSSRSLEARSLQATATRYPIRRETNSFRRGIDQGLDPSCVLVLVAAPAATVVCLIRHSPNDDQHRAVSQVQALLPPRVQLHRATASRTGHSGRRPGTCGHAAPWQHVAATGRVGRTSCRGRIVYRPPGADGFGKTCHSRPSTVLSPVLALATTMHPAGGVGVGPRTVLPARTSRTSPGGRYRLRGSACRPFGSR
jgi:hypothetical protein